MSGGEQDHWLQNERVRLRAPEPEDLAFLYRWENDVSIWDTGSTIAPYSRYELRRYIADSAHDIYQDRQLRLMITVPGSDQLVGMADLFDFDPFHGRAEAGILIASESRRNQFAFSALQLLSGYALDFLGLHQLYAYIPATNRASLDLFSKAGYEQIGVLKEWVKRGDRYTDVVFVQRLGGTSSGR